MRIYRPTAEMERWRVISAANLALCKMVKAAPKSRHNKLLKPGWRALTMFGWLSESGLWTYQMAG